MNYQLTVILTLAKNSDIVFKCNAGIVGDNMLKVIASFLNDFEATPYTVSFQFTPTK